MRRRGREVELVEILDERDPRAEAALQVIAGAFRRPDRQPLSELRSEIAEIRLDLLSTPEFHLVAAVSSTGEVMGTVCGLYLAGVNAGFITYLAVDPTFRGRGVAPALRSGLVERLRQDARSEGRPDLDCVLGEVRAGNRWLKRLLRRRGVLTFDLEYFHPGMDPTEPHDRYVLYRQPVGDARPDLPASRVRRMLYAIYRRGYRVRYPLQSPGFLHMMNQLERRTTVGPHPEFEAA